MERAELAARLVTADDAEREALLRLHPALADVQLAYALKDICLEDWSGSPSRATGAAAALRALAALVHDAEVEALALWIEGFASVVAEGRTERAVKLLEESESLFLSLGKAHAAASTQVIKLYALALLGRYDEAVDCGLRAREVLAEHGDLRAAAKIEHNIGNIYLRRDRYREAERFQLAARERFAQLGDRKQLAKTDNNLAIIYSAQHKFRRAEELYDDALKNAEQSGSVLTQAEIEASMGNLALFRGRYDRALDYLERSRRKYTALGMPHLAAVAEQEMADAYLELNLVPEAAGVYERVTKTFAELGMQGEQARCLAQQARALILMKRLGHEAHAPLFEARRLYAAEGNQVGAAVVTLTEAELNYAEGDFEAAARAALAAEGPLAAAGTLRRQLLARWLRGEAARAAGIKDEARQLLESTLTDAEAGSQPDIAQRCHTSLGLLASAAGDVRSAEESFKRAVEIIEDLRAPLPAEEFRTAFFADKLIPYNELVRLCLNDGRGERAAEAFVLAERARSRALVDALGGAMKSQGQPRDPFEARLLSRLEELREELNWFYSNINRPSGGDPSANTSGMNSLHEAAREREGEVLEITRQLRQRGEGAMTESRALDQEELQRRLGDGSAFLEYASLDDELLAFVVTNEGVQVVRRLCGEGEVTGLLTRLRFQMDTLRFGSKAVRRHMGELTRRTQHHLRELYDLLLRPVEKLLGDRRLIVAPHRTLYYAPFHALHDGEGYVVERREVSYAPSAVVLLHCLDRPRRPLQRALLLGVADEQTPLVRGEIEAISPLFPEAVSLLDEAATVAALKEFAPMADVLHLACHGQFRPDNPLFSSLRLGDGWLTVRDAYALELKCGLAALSACETGVNEVAPGDELIGLARGFFSAGAPTLLLSLWTVDDEATGRLMASFYTSLLGGSTPAASLRDAQLRLMREEPHPFFWSPFMVVGRP